MVVSYSLENKIKGGGGGAGELYTSWVLVDNSEIM